MADFGQDRVPQARESVSRSKLRGRDDVHALRPAAADGAASGGAGGSAQPRRSESASPNADGLAGNTAGQRWIRKQRPAGRLTCSSSHKSTSRAVRAGEPDAALWFRLVGRDRRLLLLLSEHKVLTTNQIAAIEFASVRRAQDRLRRLRELGVVFAFRESYATGGTSQTRFALGYAGARLLAARRGLRPPTPKAHMESLERLAMWPKLRHELGVNDFFSGLAAHRNPTRRRGGAVDGLTQWWSEAQCIEFFQKSYGERPVTLRPDAYGCWEENGRVVRFFLEHDTGTETLGKVTAKVSDYRAFPTDAFGVVLFSVHSTRREIALRAAFRRDLPASRPRVVIAMAARDHGHPDGPAGPIWAVWTPQSRDLVSRRHRLAELPERGPRIEHGPSSIDQPFNEAGFSPYDSEMKARIDTWRRRPVDLAHYEEDGDRQGEVVILPDDLGDDDPYLLSADWLSDSATRRPNETPRPARDQRDEASRRNSRISGTVVRRAGL